MCKCVHGERSRRSISKTLHGEHSGLRKKHITGCEVRKLSEQVNVQLILGMLCELNGH